MQLINNSLFIFNSSTKGAAHLATALEALPHSLHTLIISESNIGTKGMQARVVVVVFVSPDLTNTTHACGLRVELPHTKTFPYRR